MQYIIFIEYFLILDDIFDIQCFYFQLFVKFKESFVILMKFLKLILGLLYYNQKKMIMILLKRLFEKGKDLYEVELN